MSRLQDVIQQGIRADQPLATNVSVGTLYGVTDEDDIVERSDGSAWQPYSPTSIAAVQVVNTETGAVATGTTTIPTDDTIPQKTEGTEFMTLAVTPTSATNKLVIDVVVNMAHDAASSQLIVAALFQDAANDALAAMMQNAGQNLSVNLKFTHYMTAGTTSATTFKVRCGTGGASTVTFNGQGGTRFLGGVMASSITISEVLP